MPKKVNIFAQDDRAAGKAIIGQVISFLCVFMPETLAKRIASIILLAGGVEDKHVTSLTGLCDRSVRGLRRDISGGGQISGLLKVGGGGRKSKLEGLEEEIAKKIESNDCHSQQEIADMVQAEFGVKVHRASIARLLKKNGIK